MTPVIAAFTLEVRDTQTARGRGVFATTDIPAGAVVEKCPVIQLNMPYEDMPLELKRFVFNWGFLAKSDTPCAIALGFGSLYNHANPSNLRYVASAEDSCIHFVATRDIRVGQELTINYDSDTGVTPEGESEWFQKMAVEEIV